MSLNKSSALYILLGLVSILVIFFLKFLGADKHSPIPPDPSENNIINEGVVSTPDVNSDPGVVSTPDPNPMSDETDRIYQIKQMYEYVKTLNVIKVKRGRAITNPGGSIVEGEDEGENLHSAKIMFYEEGYKVYSASFDQYEGNEGLLIYYNNNDMFFCVYSNSAEGDTEQYRLYFDKYTNVIKMTYKEKNSDSSERGPYDIIDSRKVQEIRRIVLDFKRKIEIMCI